MATIRDVAKLAGVSVATVSRVINQNGYVNTDTEHKVQAAIQELDYHPNAVARGLASKRSGMIALVLPDLLNPFFPQLSKAVFEVAKKHGFTVILWSSEEDGEEKSYLQLMKNKYIDGIIFASQTLSHEDVAEMERNQIPFVVLDRAPLRDHASVVRSKNYQGATMALEHLLDIGSKKIACIYGPQDLVTAQERLLAYRDIASKFGWYQPTLMVPGQFEIEAGQRAMDQLLLDHPDIDGVFACNDLMAIGAMKSLHRKRIQIPEQVAVCGFDGILISEMMEPGLTTVAQPIYEMGSLATEILMEKISGQSAEGQVYELDVQLLVRGSTRRESNKI